MDNTNGVLRWLQAGLMLACVTLWFIAAIVPNAAVWLVVLLAVLGLAAIFTSISLLRSHPKGPYSDWFRNSDPQEWRRLHPYGEVLMMSELFRFLKNDASRNPDSARVKAVTRRHVVFIAWVCVAVIAGGVGVVVSSTIATG